MEGFGGTGIYFKMTGFQRTSYQLHQEHFQDKHDPSLLDRTFNQSTVDFWRHQRMYDTARPLLNHFSECKWLTVGDGRYGKDAVRLKSMSPQIDILPTDISPHLLKQAQKIGLIQEYGQENAESLSYRDDSFDVVFCKEAYHHFPRPYIALYEMLRVARQAVILIEPNDAEDKPLLRHINLSIRKLLKRALGVDNDYHRDTTRFEPVGNYIYSISAREMEKVALGLSLPVVAYKYMNDYYEEGVEDAVAHSSVLYHKVARRIKRLDLLSRLSLQPYGLLIQIIFKNHPTDQLLKELRDGGFKIVHLPRNPYLNMP